MTTVARKISRNREIKLDEKDKAIIRELKADSSQQATDIANKTGISKQVVGYRIKDLLKKGAIRACRTILDLDTLGYKTFDILIQYKTLADEQKLLQELEKHPSVIIYQTATGEADLTMRIWARDSSEAKRTISEIDIKNGNFISSAEILLIDKTGKDAQKEPNKEKARPDDTDMIILEELAKDSRTTMLQLAKKTKLSANAIGHRVRNLTNNGTIAGSTILEGQTGTKHKVLLKTKNLPERTEVFLAYIKKKHPQTSVDRLVGRWDIAIDVETSDNELRDMLIEMRNLFPDVIASHAMVKILSENKMNYLPMGKND